MRHSTVNGSGNYKRINFPSSFSMSFIGEKLSSMSVVGYDDDVSIKVLTVHIQIMAYRLTRRLDIFPVFPVFPVSPVLSSSPSQASFDLPSSVPAAVRWKNLLRCGLMKLLKMHFSRVHQKKETRKNRERGNIICILRARKRGREGLHINNLKSLWHEVLSFFFGAL